MDNNTSYYIMFNVTLRCLYISILKGLWEFVRNVKDDCKTVLSRLVQYGVVVFFFFEKLITLCPVI